MSTPPRALVTGVSSGIGAAIAQTLLAAGWTVDGVSRTRVDGWGAALNSHPSICPTTAVRRPVWPICPRRMPWCMPQA